MQSQRPVLGFHQSGRRRKRNRMIDFHGLVFVWRTESPLHLLIRGL